MKVEGSTTGEDAALASSPGPRALGPLESDAAEYAALRCYGQVRAGRGKQSVTEHFGEVADLLAMAGLEDSVCAVGRLHDVIEDGRGLPKAEIALEVRRLFGDEVADIVEWLTDPDDFDRLPMKERKARQAERIANAPRLVKCGKIADQTSNLRSIAADPPVRWSREKRLTYIEGARAIAEACEGASPVLEEQFALAYAAALRNVTAGASEEPTP